MSRRCPLRKAGLACLLMLISNCGSQGSFELTVVNTLQSGDILRVDLAGDSRQLNIGDFTVYRSIAAGANILSIEGSGCAGTIRDTLNIHADSTVRYLISRAPATGECEVVSNFTVPRRNPAGF